MPEPGNRAVRAFWFEVHKYLGLACLVFLILAGASGTLLVFRSGLDEALNRDLFRTEPRPALAPPALAGQLAKQRPDLIVTSLPARAEPGRALVVGVAARAGGLAYDQVFLDPHDGRVLGARKDAPAWSRRGLMRGVYAFHYTLLAGDAGRLFMGAIATAWFVSNLVGFYLTLPAGPGGFWRRWKPLWTVKLGARLPRLFLDLHRASGLWLLAFATVLAFTSVAMNFYDEAAAPLAQALSPARPSPFDGAGRAAAAGPRIGFGQALDAARAQAARELPGWRAVKALYIPERGLYGVTFTRSGADTYAGLGPVAFYFDDQSGRFVYRDDPGRDSAGRAALRALYPLHSGQVFGWPTRLLVAVLGLATVEMSVTGLYLWLKKRGPRAAARRAARTSAGAAA